MTYISKVPVDNFPKITTTSPFTYHVTLDEGGGLSENIILFHRVQGWPKIGSCYT